MPKIKNIIIGIAVGFVNGLFGAGGGSVLVPLIKMFDKVDPKVAHATAISIILPLCAVSSYSYINNNAVDIKILIFVSIGGVIGGILGAKFLKKISVTALKRMFGIILIISALRMLFK